MSYSDCDNGRPDISPIRYPLEPRHDSNDADGHSRETPNEKVANGVLARGKVVEATLTIPFSKLIQEANKYISPELKLALAIGPSANALFAIRSVPWIVHAHGVCFHVIIGSKNEIGITVESSPLHTMIEIKEKHIANLNEQMEDSEDFEPNAYNKFWGQSNADHWATVAVIPMVGLGSEELAHRHHMALVIEVFLSYWMCTYSKAASPRLSTSMEAMHLSVYGVASACVPLRMSVPTAPSHVGVNAASANRIIRYLSNRISLRIPDTTLETLLR